MTLSDTVRLALCMLFLTTTATAVAQGSADDAADVILTIEEQWERAQEGDHDWLDEELMPNFSGWPVHAPAPRSKVSTAKWTRFFQTQGKMVEHELFFQNIVVHGDVAVAHYFYTSATEDNDGEVKVEHGRFTDVLVRTADSWKFLAWHGGNTD